MSYTGSLNQSLTRGGYYPSWFRLLKNAPQEPGSTPETTWLLTQMEMERMLESQPNIVKSSNFSTYVSFLPFDAALLLSLISIDDRQTRE